MVRIGIILMIIGVGVLLIANSFLSRAYNVVTEVISNATISIDTYSRYLMPIYVNNPAYVVVLLNGSYSLPMYLLDQFGHVLTPLSYRQVHNAYLVTFQLVHYGNYSLVLFNDNPRPLNVSILITVISRYMVSSAAMANVIMGLGVMIFIVGVLFIMINALFIIKYRPPETR